MRNLGLTNIGNMWHELAANDSAVFYHLKAMKIKEELNKPGDVAISLANIANAYSDLGAYDKAIEMLKRALILRREMGEEKATAIMSDAVEKVKQSGKSRVTKKDIKPKEKKEKEY